MTAPAGQDACPLTPQEFGDLKAALKSLCRVYQVEEKTAAARRLGLEPDAFYSGLEYAQWADLRAHYHAAVQS